MVATSRFGNINSGNGSGSQGENILSATISRFSRGNTTTVGTGGGTGTGSRFFLPIPAGLDTNNDRVVSDEEVVNALLSNNSQINRPTALQYYNSKAPQISGLIASVDSDNNREISDTEILSSLIALKQGNSTLKGYKDRLGETLVNQVLNKNTNRTNLEYQLNLFDSNSDGQITFNEMILAYRAVKREVPGMEAANPRVQFLERFIQANRTQTASFQALRPYLDRLLTGGVSAGEINFAELGKIITEIKNPRTPMPNATTNVANTTLAPSPSVDRAALINAMKQLLSSDSLSFRVLEKLTPQASFTVSELREINALFDNNGISRTELPALEALSNATLFLDPNNDGNVSVPEFLDGFVGLKKQFGSQDTNPVWGLVDSIIEGAVNKDELKGRQATLNRIFVGGNINYQNIGREITRIKSQQTLSAPVKQTFAAILGASQAQGMITQAQKDSFTTKVNDVRTIAEAHALIEEMRAYWPTNNPNYAAHQNNLNNLKANLAWEGLNSAAVAIPGQTNSEVLDSVRFALLSNIPGANSQTWINSILGVSVASGKITVNQQAAFISRFNAITDLSELAQIVADMKGYWSDNQSHINNVNALEQQLRSDFALKDVVDKLSAGSGMAGYEYLGIYDVVSSRSLDPEARSVIDNIRSIYSAEDLFPMIDSMGREFSTGGQTRTIEETMAKFKSFVLRPGQSTYEGKRYELGLTILNRVSHTESIIVHVGNGIDSNNDGTFTDAEIVGGMLKARRGGFGQSLIPSHFDKFFERLGETRSRNIDAILRTFDPDQDGAIAGELMVGAILANVIGHTDPALAEATNKNLAIFRQDPGFAAIENLVNKVRINPGASSMSFGASVLTALAGAEIDANEASILLGAKGLRMDSPEIVRIQGHINNFRTWQPNGFEEGFASDRIVLRRIGENIRGIASDGPDIVSILATNPDYTRFANLINQVRVGTGPNAFDQSSFIKIAYKAYLGQITPEEHNLINLEVLNYANTVNRSVPEIANGFDHRAYASIFAQLDPSKTGTLSQTKFNEINTYLAGRVNVASRDPVKDALYNFDGRGPAEVDGVDHAYLVQVAGVLGFTASANPINSTPVTTTPPVTPTTPTAPVTTTPPVTPTTPVTPAPTITPEQRLAIISQFTAIDPNGFANGVASDTVVVEMLARQARGTSTIDAATRSLLETNIGYARLANVINLIKQGNTFDRYSLIKLRLLENMNKANYTLDPAGNDSERNLIITRLITPADSSVTHDKHVAIVNALNYLDANHDGIADIPAARYNELITYIGSRGARSQAGANPGLDPALESVLNFNGLNNGIDQEDHATLIEVYGLLTNDVWLATKPQ